MENRSSNAEPLEVISFQMSFPFLGPDIGVGVQVREGAAIKVTAWDRAKERTILLQHHMEITWMYYVPGVSATPQGVKSTMIAWADGLVSAPAGLVQCLSWMVGSRRMSWAIPVGDARFSMDPLKLTGGTLFAICYDATPSYVTAAWCGPWDSFPHTSEPGLDGFHGSTAELLKEIGLPCI